MPTPITPLTDNYRPEPLATLQRHPKVQKAFHFIKTAATQFTDEHIRVCEIPAPPFNEHERAQFVAQRFMELGLVDVHTDPEGNVIGLLHGATDTPMVCVSAHMDTVFPENTAITVRKYASRLLAPGIGDNAAGVAALLALIQLLRVAEICPHATIIFVATVGEEGEGDLRGARYLFTQGDFASRITHFISIDGPGSDFITHQALGSRRYRITLAGPGGHSWTDFGFVNPVHALCRAVAKLAEFPVPWEPRTTYNVGRIVGGDSVNVIPEQASIDVDIRSTDERELARVEDYLLSAVNQAVRAENSLRAASHHSLGVDVKLIGHRPSGEISAQAPLVLAALEASKAVGLKPHLNCASTDANIPISLGIPAITIGAGGRGGDAHRLSEWYDATGRDIGYQRALLLILAMSGLVE